MDWDRATRLAKEASGARNREVNVEVAGLLRLIAEHFEAMAGALEDDDEIMGSLAGTGIANHMPLLPAHVRHTFIECLDDEAARAARADALYLAAHAEDV